jgi:hypothetical protein
MARDCKNEQMKRAGMTLATLWAGKLHDAILDLKSGWSSKIVIESGAFPFGASAKVPFTRTDFPTIEAAFGADASGANASRSFVLETRSVGLPRPNI